MSKTSIAWTERTWNPITGCTKLSAACAHCYAETMAKRLQYMGQKRYANGFALTLHPEALNEPKRIKQPSMFFVCSMSDIFHEDVPESFIDKIMDVIKATPEHTYQILTKRTDRMYNYFTYGMYPVPDNAWIGTTVEDDRYAERARILASIKPANVRFLSIEPMLGPFGWLNLEGIDWVIVGGESGPQARPMKKEWVLDLQKQCAAQDVPFFFKQWGTWGEDGIKRDKKANGCLLDGKVYQEWPKARKGGQNEGI